MARLLGPTGVGAFVLAINLVATLAILGRFGLPQAAIRLIEPSSGRGESDALEVVVVSVGFAVLLALAFGLVGHRLAAELFNAPILNAAALAIALLIAGDVVRAVVSECFRALGDVRRATVFGDASKGALVVATLGAGFVMSRWRVSTSTVLASFAIAAMVPAVCGVASLVRRAISVRLRVGPRFVIAMVSTAGPLLVVNLTLAGINYADLWVVGASRPLADAARYGVASRLALLLALPITIAYAAGIRRTADLVNGDGDAEEFLRSIATVAALPTVAGFLALVVGGTQLLRLLFGAFYANAALLVVVLAAGQVVNVLSGLCAATLIVNGRQRMVMRVSLVTAALTVAGELFAVRPFGVVGVAAVSSLAVVVQNTWLVLTVRREFGLLTVAYASPARAFRVLRAQ